jgi:hypothetical protein
LEWRFISDTEGTTAGWRGLKSLPPGIEVDWRRSALGISLTARLVFAAGGRVVRVVDENVIVARGADEAVNRFVELIVAGIICAVFPACLLAADGNWDSSFFVQGFQAGDVVNR